MRKIRTIEAVLLIIVAGLFFSCATTPRQTLEKIIPENTVVFVEAANPDTLLKNLDDFISPLGFGFVLGNDPLKESLFTILQMEYPAISEDLFNFEKPSAFALIPRTPGGPNKMDFIPIFYFPLKNTNKSSEILSSHFKEGTYKTVGDYFVLSLSEDFILDFPLENHADLSILSEYSSEGITMLIDIKEMFKGVDWKSELKKAQQNLTEEESLQLDSAYALLEGIFKLIDQLSLFSNEFIADKDGFRSKSIIAFQEGESVNSFLQDAAPKAGAPPIADLLKYIPENYLFSIAVNTNPDAFKPAFKDLLTFVYEVMIAQGLELTQADFDELTDFTNQAADAFGGRFVMALDYEFNLMPYISGTSPAGTDLIKFDGIGVFDIKDIEKYRDMMEKGSQLGFIKKMSDYTYKTSGIGMEYTYEKDLTYKTLTYDRYYFKATFDAEMLPEFDNEEAEKIYMDMMNSFIDKMTFNLAYKDDKAYIVLGSENLDSLVSLVETDSIEGRTLADTESLETLRKDLPDSTISFGHFSVARLGQIIMNNLTELGTSPEEMSTENAPGFVGYSVIEDNKLVSFSYWFMDELKEIMIKFFGLFPMIMSQTQI